MDGRGRRGWSWDVEKVLGGMERDGVGGRAYLAGAARVVGARWVREGPRVWPIAKSTSNIPAPGPNLQPPPPAGSVVVADYSCWFCCC